MPYETVKYKGVDGSGRSASRKIITEYNCEIAFLRCDYDYRVYDEGAIKLCRILDADPYYNANGDAGILIRKEDLKTYVLPALKSTGLSFSVNDTKLTVYSCNKVPQETDPAPCRNSSKIKLGYEVILSDSHNRKFAVLLAEKESGVKRMITRPDGTVEFIEEPVIARNGIRILSPNTPLSQALIGHKSGDIVICNGEEYKIIGFKKS